MSPRLPCRPQRPHPCCPHLRCAPSTGHPGLAQHVQTGTCVDDRSFIFTCADGGAWRSPGGVPAASRQPQGWPALHRVQGRGGGTTCLDGPLCSAARSSDKSCIFSNELGLTCRTSCSPGACPSGRPSAAMRACTGLSCRWLSPRCAQHHLPRLLLAPHQGSSCGTVTSFNAICASLRSTARQQQ